MPTSPAGGHAARGATSRHLILLCHAATRATHRAAFPADEGIDPGVSGNLSLLRRRLPGAAHILSSPARAARETAVGLAAAIAVATEPALADCDYGSWRGRSLDELLAADPQAAGLWMSDPHAAPHGGESHAALAARVGLWLDGLGPGPTLVAVTHASVIRAALLHALEAPLAGFWRIDVPPLGRVALSWAAGRWQWRAGVAG